jgi:hypothetical protein
MVHAHEGSIEEEVNEHGATAHIHDHNAPADETGLGSL